MPVRLSQSQGHSLLSHLQIQARLSQSQDHSLLSHLQIQARLSQSQGHSLLSHLQIQARLSQSVRSKFKVKVKGQSHRKVSYLKQLLSPHLLFQPQLFLALLSLQLSLLSLLKHCGPFDNVFSNTDTYDQRSVGYRFYAVVVNN